MPADMSSTSSVFQAASELLKKQYGETYNAFAGVDITAYIGPIELGTLQAVTYSVARETGSLYTFGNVGPRNFVRGKRAISGSLVFTQFDRDVIIRLMEEIKPKTSTSEAYTLSDVLGVSEYNEESPNFDLLIGGGLTGGLSGDLQVAGAFGTAVRKKMAQSLNKVLSRPFRYGDQVPPFNISIILANEQGAAATKSILNVVLVNEGGGYTVDDLQSQVAYTFLAKDITPLTTMAPRADNKNYVGEWRTAN